MRLKSTIETTANLATIGAAVVVSFVLVKAYLLPSPTPRLPPTGPTVAVGTNLHDRVTGVDWDRNGRTLVIAMSTRCHFCTDSAPFYRRLRKEAAGIRVVAVFPETVSEAEHYLSSNGVHPDQVKQISLPALGIHGTPTMLLVDNKGSVQNVWVGKLETDQQNKVLRAVLSSHT